MAPSTWFSLTLLAGFAYCGSLGERFPHSRFYGGVMNIAAAPEDEFDLWYKPAPYYGVQEQMASSPWPVGGGHPPEVSLRPAWGGYVAIVTLGLVAILLDAGTVRMAAARMFSFETTAVLSLTGIAIGAFIYLQKFGPRYSLRILLAVITVLAGILALAFQR
jgi:energy-converting hydrogenase Eha subunit A